MTETSAAAVFTDPRLTRAIELIWREADLLDRKDYHTWQHLYTADGRYVVPIDQVALDKAPHYDAQAERPDYTDDYGRKVYDYYGVAWQ